METSGMQNIVNLAVYAGVIIAVLFIIGFSLSRMYRKSTNDKSLVKTGLGGEKVITSGGTLLIPGFQELRYVNMRTLRMRVERREGEALITQDFMRVDVSADFYVRVKSDAESISKAAQALGDRLDDPDLVRELMESKYVGALRSAASTMSMAELHQNRAAFILAVQDAISEELSQNGLELESVSLTSFDQTKLEYFDENNAFDADGKARLAETIESRKKRTNEIEQENRIAIEKRNLQADRESLDIAQSKREAEIEQRRIIETREAEQKAAIATSREENSSLELVAELKKERAIEAEAIDKKLAIEKREIEKQRDIEVSQQERMIIVAEKSQKESAARALAAEAEETAVIREEAVKTAQEVAGAERQKSIDVIDAKRLAEREAVGITVAAEATKKAAQDEADARLIVARADADAVSVKAEADKKAFAVEAEGRLALNRADNELSPEQVQLRIKLALIEALPKVVAEAVEPLKNIEGIKILQGYNGSTGSHGNGSGGSNDAMGNLTNAALAYKAQSPLLASLLDEIGLTSVEDIVSGKSMGDLVSEGDLKAEVESTSKSDVEEILPQFKED